MSVTNSRAGSVAGCLALFFEISFFCSRASAQAIEKYYGAPYYHHGPSKIGPYPSVGSAIDGWFEGWKNSWPDYAYCTFITKYYDPAEDNSPNNPLVAGVTLNEPCSGGDAITATEYLGFLPERNLGPSTCQTPDVTCGNPINVAIGNKYQEEKDYESPGLLAFSRFYNSDASAGSSEFGPSWTHSFSSSLERVGGTSIGSIVSVTRPQGQRYRFMWDGLIWRADGDVTFVLNEVIDPTGVSTGWRLISKETGVKEYFDSAGYLTRVESRDGNFVSLLYQQGSSLSVRSCLMAVTERSGRSLSFECGSGGKIQKMLTPAGALHSYGYGSSGRLASVDFGQDGGRDYVYDEVGHVALGARLGLLTGIFDESGSQFATFQYAADSRAISTFHGSGVDLFSVQYVSDSRTIVTGPLGAAQARELAGEFGVMKIASVVESCSGCVSLQRAYTYGTNGRIDTIAEGASRKDFDFDDDGNFVRLNESGVGVSRTTERDWLLSQFLISEERLFDGSKIISNKSYSYSDAGLLLSESASDSVTGIRRERAYTYCAEGNPADGCAFSGQVRVISSGFGEIGRVFSYYSADATSCSQSPANCQYRRGDLWRVKNDLGQIFEIVAYDGDGRPLSVRDYNGVTTDYTYSPRGWLTATKVRGADDTTESDDRITRMEYRPTGLVKKVTQPDGAFTAYTYDAAHRLTDITDNAGNTIHYTLDNAGNRIAEDTKDASGTLKRTLSRVYNQLGQLATQADAAANPTDFGYDANGNATSVTDALARVTQSEYDPLNRLKRTLQDVGGIAAETKFAYDALDHLTEVTDPKGLKTTYTYNGLGDLTQQVSPDTGTTTFTYDSAGNRATQTDARNKTTTYSYDALNRLIGMAYADTSLNVTYTYDTTQSVCTVTESFSVGRLTRMQDGSGITQYCYNRFGDLTRKVQTVNGVALQLRYGYATSGQLTSMTYPDGAVVDYVRDGQGHITEVGVTPNAGVRQVLLTGATYHPFGPVAGWTYGNGRQMSRTLDLDYRPAAIHDSSTGGLSVGFNYDEVGNLVELTQPGSTLPEVGFGYDALGRLIQFKDGPTGTVIDGYGYDKTGNRTSLTTATGTSTYTYPTTSHRLAQVGAIPRTYDAAGNTTEINGTARQFVYDDTGRMSSVQASGVTTRDYRHNGRGERVRGFLDSANTYTLYDEAGHWVGDYDNAGTPVQQAIWMDDLPVGLRTSAAGTLTYIEPDHLGSPRVVIEPVANTAIWKWDLKGEAFGATAPDQDPDANGAAFNLDMRFPGQRFDAATGLYYNFFRDYGPGEGSYVQSDPIGLNGGISTYGYVDSNPLLLTDVYGLQISVPWVAPMVKPAPFSAPIDVAPLFGPRTPRDPYGEYCRSLLRRILSTRDEIYNKRIPDLAKNPNPLPWRIGPGEDLRETIRGHEKLLNRRLRELRKIEDEYDKECGPATMACESTGSAEMSHG